MLQQFRKIFQRLHPCSSPLPAPVLRKHAFSTIESVHGVTCPSSTSMYGTSEYCTQTLSKYTYTWKGCCSFGPMLASKTHFSSKRSTSAVSSRYHPPLLSIPIGYCTKVHEETTYLYRQPEACREGFKASREFRVKINSLRNAMDIQARETPERNELPM